jgi:hypothetical protein
MPSDHVSGFEDIGLLTRHGRLVCGSYSSGRRFACGSFRFRLTADTLAVRPAVPRDGPAEDLHLQVRAPLPGAPIIIRQLKIAGLRPNKQGYGVRRKACQGAPQETAGLSVCKTGGKLFHFLKGQVCSVNNISKRHFFSQEFPGNLQPPFQPPFL